MADMPSSTSPVSSLHGCQIRQRIHKLRHSGIANKNNWPNSPTDWPVFIDLSVYDCFVYDASCRYINLSNFPLKVPICTPVVSLISPGIALNSLIFCVGLLNITLEFLLLLDHFTLFAFIV